MRWGKSFIVQAPGPGVKVTKLLDSEKDMNLKHFVSFNDDIVINYAEHNL
jgi:hypothetical protein